MRDVLDELLSWWSAGAPAALATVVATSGGAPRPPGAMMALGPDGVVGGVSGGCVEASVHELSERVLADGVTRFQRFQAPPGDVVAVGMPCGGAIDVLVERVDPERFPELGEVAASLRAGAPVAVVTGFDQPAAGEGPAPARRLVVWPDRTAGSLGGPALDAAATARARRALAAGEAGLTRDEAGTVASYPAPPRLLVFGSAQCAAAISQLGTFLGYRVTVCDRRPVFATRRRFPAAADVVVRWPDEYLSDEVAAGRVDHRTVICVVTHDPTVDAALLRVALGLPVAYVGAMGSRRTHGDLVDRLVEEGVTPDELARLAAPIGLDLRSEDSPEIAVSILAEVLAVVRGGSGGRLRSLRGPIHAARVPAAPARAAAAPLLPAAART
jgi:xanthine dehydrogenase accessory factor